MAFTPTALALAAKAPIDLFNSYHLGQTAPVERNSRDAYELLAKAMDKRIDEINAPPDLVTIEQPIESVPAKGFEGQRDVLLNPNKYASSGINTAGNNYIKINPNADRAIFAHELGHITSQQTQVGRLVNQARHNPRLAKSLMAAALLAPGSISALTPGDDDTTAAILTAYAAAMPTLIDEGLATKNGLAIMNHAGMRATMGQRGKLAGAYLSYLAAPLLIGAAGNTVGNLIDEDKPIELGQ